MKAETKLGSLIAAVERIAKCKFDGHYSLFSFTTNYKGCYGTPINLDGINAYFPAGGPNGRNIEMRDDIHDLPAHSSMEELLYCMAEQPYNYLMPYYKEKMKPTDMVRTAH